MATTIYFDADYFRQLFPAFSNSTTYPDATIAVWWDVATGYINDQYGGAYCGTMSLKQQTLALNYMTAHLLYLSTTITANGSNGGGTIGVETSATIDKISVSVQPPPAPDAWQYWLQTSAYGQQLLALLSVAAVGGIYINPRPVLTAFRR